MAGYLYRFREAIRKDWDRIFLKNRELDMLGKDVKNPYSESDIYYSCVKRTAQAISQIPWNVVETLEDEDGEQYEEPIIDEEHPAVKIFMVPNPILSRFEFWEAIVTYYMDQGEAFVVPFPYLSQLKRGEWPTDLFVVDPSQMTEVTDPQTRMIAGWDYRPTAGKEPISFKMADVLFWRNYNPFNPYRGLKPIDILRVAIDSDFKAAKYNETFFDHGATVSAVIEVGANEKGQKKLTTTQYDRLMTRLEQRHQGFQKAHRLMLLEGGAQYKEIGLKQTDMAWLEGRRDAAERIMMVLGMKKAVLSVTEDLNLAIAREQKKSWWTDTNLPIMRMIQDRFRHRFWPVMPQQGLKGYFDTTVIDELQEDFNAKVETGAKLWTMGFTANEINDRLSLGFEDTEWRDIAYVPMSLVSVSDPIVEEPATPEDLPPEGPPEEPDEEDDAEDFGKQSVLTRIGSQNQWSEEKAASVWKNFTRLVAPLERKYERKTQRLFFDMRRKALAALKKSEYRGVKGIHDVGALDWHQEEKDIVKYSKPFYEGGLKAGFKYTADLIGVTDLAWQTEYPGALKFMSQKSLKVKGIVHTVEKQLKEVSKTAIKEGWSIDQAEQAIKDTFNFASKRARVIARTEVIGAANAGSLIAMKESGVVEWQMWYTAMDERVRDSHMEAHGDKVRVGEPFIVGGAPLDFPGDPAGPPGEIIQCRCIALPLEESEYPHMAPGELEGERPELGEEPTFSSVEEARDWLKTWVADKVNIPKDCDELDLQDLQKMGAEIYKLQTEWNMPKIDVLNYKNKYGTDNYQAGWRLMGDKEFKSRLTLYQSEEIPMKNIREKMKDPKNTAELNAAFKAYLKGEKNMIHNSEFLVDMSKSSQVIERKVAHEYGHYIHDIKVREIDKTFGITRRRDEPWEYTEKSEKWMKALAPSAYGRQDTYECIAENFTAYQLGRKDLVNKKFVEYFDSLKARK